MILYLRLGKEFRLRFRLGVQKGKEWNGIIIREWKEMEKNGIK